MKIADIRDWIKQFKLVTNCYAGRIDAKKNNVLAVYNSRSPRGSTVGLGGHNFDGYKTKDVSVLIRGTTNQPASEKLAAKIYESISTAVPKIGNYEVCYVDMRDYEPIDVTGADDVFEYTIDFTVYYQ